MGVKKICYAIIINFVFLSLISCNTTEPVDNIQSGRRDYEFTFDTVKVPFSYLSRIWGTSPTDVWAVGAGEILMKLSGIMMEMNGLPMEYPGIFLLYQFMDFHQMMFGLLEMKVKFGIMMVMIGQKDWITRNQDII